MGTEDNTGRPGGPPALRVTLRCLTDDLGLSPRHAEGSASDIDHELVRKFIHLRSQDPQGTEKVQPLEYASEVFTLHAGRWRGATWHDRTNGVVWLLAGRYHRSGERDDAYPQFKALDSVGRLAPTEEDYELLFRLQERTFAEAVVEETADLLEEVRAASPAEVRRVLGGTVPVSVAVLQAGNMEIVYLAVSMRLQEGELRPPGEWLTILWAAFFPWVSDPVEELSQEDEIAGRPRANDELIFAAIRELG
jgi:hypothetical protein